MCYPVCPTSQNRVKNEVYQFVVNSVISFVGVNYGIHAFRCFHEKLAYCETLTCTYTWGPVHI